MQLAFTCLITLQFLIVLLHDLVEIRGWTHTSQLRAALGTRRLWITTLFNAAFPALAVIFAIEFWNRPRPLYVNRYWLIYCAIALISAIGMFYIPYLFGATDAKKLEYEKFYVGTRQILPARGNNPRPNMLHVLFHALFAFTFCLALLLQGRGR